MSPLSVEMLKKDHPSKRRNPFIAIIFFRTGFIEAWGRGTLLMSEEMKNADLPEPIIEEYAGGFQITFLKGGQKGGQWWSMVVNGCQWLLMVVNE